MLHYFNLHAINRVAHSKVQLLLQPLHPAGKTANTPIPQSNSLRKMTGPSFFAPIFSGFHDGGASSGSFSVHQSVRPPPSAPRTISRPTPRSCPTPSGVSPSNPLGANYGSLALSTIPESPPRSVASIAPPAYATSSPPKYAPLPADEERALLLAPPPTFHDAINYCRNCEVELAHHHRLNCPNYRRGSGPAADWVVRLLILLNIVVWSAVVWGYWSEWNNLPEGSIGWGCGDVLGGGQWSGCVDTGRTLGGRAVYHCDMALEDC